MSKEIRSDLSQEVGSLETPDKYKARRERNLRSRIYRRNKALNTSTQDEFTTTDQKLIVEREKLEEAVQIIRRDLGKCV